MADQDRWRNEARRYGDADFDRDRAYGSRDYGRGEDYRGGESRSYRSDWRDQGSDYQYGRGQDDYGRSQAPGGYGRGHDRNSDYGYGGGGYGAYGSGQAGFGGGYGGQDFGGGWRGGVRSDWNTQGIGRQDYDRDYRGSQGRDYTADLYGRDYWGGQGGYQTGAGQSYGRHGYGYGGTYGYGGGQVHGRGGQSYGPAYGSPSYGSQSYGGPDYGRADWNRDNRGGQDRGLWDRARDEVSSWFGDEDASRRRERDHTGRGPKGYTRSDERIREDVSDRLSDDYAVDASEIEVGVASGEVTLSGTVGSREEKRRAEDIAERVSGVSHVQNNLRVNRNRSASGQWNTGETGTHGEFDTVSTGGSIGSASGARTSNTGTGTQAGARKSGA